MRFREGFDKGYSRDPDEEHSGWYWLGYGLSFMVLAVIVAVGINLILRAF